MKIKRILGCLLVVTLMTSLMVGCSTGTSETPRPQPNPAPSTTPSPTPTPNEDEVVDLTPEETLSELTGYVVKIDEGGRVLVVSDKSTSFAETGGDNEFYQAIYFAEMPEGVEVGDKVKVEYGIVLESYPGQTKAEKAEIFESNIPDGAKKSEKEAIATALETISTEDEEGMNNFAVKSVKFNKDNSNWEVELFNIFTEETHKVEVQD